MAWLSESELAQMGFEHVGKHVRVSTRASFYAQDKIALHDHCRLDDFSVLSAGSGGISVGRFVHIGVFSSLIGGGRIAVGDFCDISSRVSIYGNNEDYSGATITPPTVPDAYRGVAKGDVTLGRHVIVASGSIILPDVTLADGAAIGALSLVKRDCEAFSIYAGVPARFIKTRNRDLLEVEQRMLREIPDDWHA